MTKGLRAVQLAFWVVVAASAAALALARPVEHDAAYYLARQEIATLAASLDRTAQEQATSLEARSQARIDLGSLARQTTIAGVLHVKAKANAAPIEPLAPVVLDTLAALNAHARHDVKVRVAVPDAAGMVSALRWRLAAQPPAPAPVTGAAPESNTAAPESNTAAPVPPQPKIPEFELESIAWRPVQGQRVGPKREQEIEQLRLRVAQARLELEQAQAERDRAEAVFRYRRDNNIDIKLRREAWLNVVASREKVRQLSGELRSLGKRYDRLSRKALAYRSPRTGALEAAELAGVVAALVGPAANRLKLEFPAPLVRRSVAVTPVPLAGFDATKAADLWPELASMSPVEALQAVEGKFSWHNQGMEVSEFKIGGRTVLQAIPAALIVPLLAVALFCRSARSGYHPFHSAGWRLPVLGIGSSLLNCLALIGLPLAAGLTCVWTLSRIQGHPVIPLLLTAIGVVAAVWACKEMVQVQNLRRQVTRMSNPPSDLPASTLPPPLDAARSPIPPPARLPSDWSGTSGPPPALSERPTLTSIPPPVPAAARRRSTPTLPPPVPEAAKRPTRPPPDAAEAGTEEGGEAPGSRAGPPALSGSEEVGLSLAEVLSDEAGSPSIEIEPDFDQDADQGGGEGPGPHIDEPKTASQPPSQGPADHPGSADEGESDDGRSPTRPAADEAAPAAVGAGKDSPLARPQGPGDEAAPLASGPKSNGEPSKKTGSKKKRRRSARSGSPTDGTIPTSEAGARSDSPKKAGTKRKRRRSGGRTRR
ncbi:MAG: hypothetical protein MJD61_04600 [Proteobacteria bacterium]|nr:hypothetical protein [Pseudomonadota bacterium]